MKMVMTIVNWMKDKQVTVGVGQGGGDRCLPYSEDLEPDQKVETGLCYYLMTLPVITLK